MINILIFLLQINLQLNVNDNAKELTQYFNSKKDSTILECEFNISKVEVYNDGYRDSIYNTGKRLSFSNDKLPLGRNTISVFTNRKIIIFNIIKEKPFAKILSVNSIDVEDFENALPSAQLDIVPNNKLVVGYWVIEDIRTSFGSHRSEFLSDSKYTKYLIRKNKIDINTKNGRLNRLTVFEVYNIRAFMDLKSEGSYNKKPLYITNNKGDN